MKVKELIRKLQDFQDDHAVVIQDETSKREASIEGVKWLYNGRATIVISCELFVPNN